MAEWESLQEYEESSPYYGVNNARMRNDGNDYRSNPVVRRTLFVEGSDDIKFFKSYLKDGSKWAVEIANKKKGVLSKYDQHRKLPTNEGTSFFCADMDFENVVDTLMDRGSAIVEDDCFFYQLYDLNGHRGFNDLESCLFLTDAYRIVMREYYDDEKVISSIRNKILKIGLLMGSYRVANILVREVNGLPEGTSILCHRRKEKASDPDDLQDESQDGSVDVNSGVSLDGSAAGITPGAKFCVCFMDVFKLVNGKTLFCPAGDAVDESLVNEFVLDEYGEHVPALIGIAAGIREQLSKNRGATFSFLRGHDLTELLALKLLYDGKISLKGNHQWSDPLHFKRRYRLLEQLRDKLEEKFRGAAVNSLDEIRKFPIGKILK